MAFPGFKLTWQGRRKIKGGVHLESRKEFTADKPIVSDFPLPERRICLCSSTRASRRNRWSEWATRC
jgi:hypothetical protein